MSAKVTTENDIKSWLEVILKSENLDNLSLKVEGNTEAGTGYVGDIFFVEANGTTKDKIDKKYNLVIKCGKRSKAFRSKFPVNCAFRNEILFYETIFPYFLQFQKDRGVKDPFDKVPKCYGTFVGADLEVIVFENLKDKRYTLWDKKKPLMRRHVEMIIQEYGKFHAISIALKHQNPEKFQQPVEKCDDFMAKLYEYTDTITTQEDLVDELYELLQDELDENILLKWKELKPKVRPFLKSLEKSEGVVIHGDCWINNFVHLHVVSKEVTKAY